MEAIIDEISPNVFRINYTPPGIPMGFSQFLIRGEKPVLIHTGHRRYFDVVADAIKRLMPIEKLYGIGFSHFEPDECGALPLLLQAAPHATAMVGRIGAMSIRDYVDAPIDTMAHNQTIQLGADLTLRFIETPHFPHGWDGCVFLLEEQRLLFSSDFAAQPGAGPAVTSYDQSDVIIDFQKQFGFMCETPDAVRTLNTIAAMDIHTLATMHGSILQGAAVNMAIDSVRQHIGNQILSFQAMEG